MRQAEQHGDDEPAQGLEQVEPEARGVGEDQAGDRVRRDLHDDVDDLGRDLVEGAQDAPPAGPRGRSSTSVTATPTTSAKNMRCSMFGVSEATAATGLLGTMVLTTVIKGVSSAALAAGLPSVRDAASEYRADSPCAVAASMRLPGRMVLASDQPDDHRDRREHDRVGEGLEPHAPELADVAHPGHADDQRREHERDHDHEQQPQEQRADGLGARGRRPTPRRDGRPRAACWRRSRPPPPPPGR